MDVVHVTCVSVPHATAGALGAAVFTATLPVTGAAVTGTTTLTGAAVAGTTKMGAAVGTLGAAVLTDITWMAVTLTGAAVGGGR